MTNLKGLDLPDRQFAVFFPRARRGASPLHQPPHRVLLHLNLAAVPHHDGGGAQQILEELQGVCINCYE